MTLPPSFQAKARDGVGAAIAALTALRNGDDGYKQVTHLDRTSMIAAVSFLATLGNQLLTTMADEYGADPEAVVQSIALAMANGLDPWPSEGTR